MTIRTSLFGLITASLMLSPITVSATMPDSANMDKHHEKMMQELKLTPDQKTKLKELRKQHMEAMKPFFEKMKGIRDKVRNELLKPQPSKQVLDGFAVELGDLHKQIAQTRNEHLLQVKAILNPDQFSKLVNREGMGPEMKGGFPHQGNWPHNKNMGKGGCKHGKGPGPETDKGPDEM
jgi:Spy/CpxP family protein refolding chaperone